MGALEVVLSTDVVVGSSVVVGASVVVSVVVGGWVVVGGSLVVAGSLVAGSVVDGSTVDDSVVVGSSDAVVVVLSMMLTALEVGSAELVGLLMTADVNVDVSKGDVVVVRGRHRLAIVMAARAGKSANEARMIDDRDRIRLKNGRGGMRNGKALFL